MQTPRSRVVLSAGMDRLQTSWEECERKRYKLWFMGLQLSRPSFVFTVYMFHAGVIIIRTSIFMPSRYPCAESGTNPRTDHERKERLRSAVQDSVFQLTEASPTAQCTRILLLRSRRLTSDNQIERILTVIFQLCITTTFVTREAMGVRKPLVYLGAAALDECYTRLKQWSSVSTRIQNSKPVI